MDEHRHNARSKGTAPAGSARDDSSSQPAHPSAPSSATSIQLLDKVNPGVQNPIKTPDDDTNPQTTVPKLFLLPDELQTIIYEFAVIEPNPIEVHVCSVTEDSKTTQWRISTSVNAGERSDVRPSVLAVCKYLRSFVAPIYFSSNKFVTRTARNAGMLRRRWGDDVKHIRRIECVVAVTVLYHTVDEGPPRSTGGWLESVEIKTDMKILGDGTLVVERYAPTSSLAKILPDWCYCRPEKIGASSWAVGKDSRRMFDVIAQCALDGQAKFVLAKTCNHCNRWCLAARHHLSRRRARAARMHERVTTHLA